MRLLNIAVSVVLIAAIAAGCGSKQTETTIKLESKDQEGVQNALEFKRQMDAQIQQQMQKSQQESAPATDAPSR